MENTKFQVSATFCFGVMLITHTHTVKLTEKNCFLKKANKKLLINRKILFLNAKTVLYY